MFSYVFTVNSDKLIFSQGCQIKKHTVLLLSTQIFTYMLEKYDWQIETDVVELNLFVCHHSLMQNKDIFKGRLKSS